MRKLDNEMDLFVFKKDFKNKKDLSGWYQVHLFYR